VPKRQKKPLKSHYPPYKRNQIRWALDCYKARTGTKWDYYALTMAEVLGIKEQGEGLNSRDPYSWIIEGQNPSPEKLALFEDFIKKAAPEYFEAFTDEGFFHGFGDFMARFLGCGEDPSHGNRQAENLMDRLESFVFVPQDHYLSVNTTPFMGFRRIGDSYYLRTYMFELDHADASGSETPESGAEAAQEEAESGDLTLRLQSPLTKLLSRNIDGQTPIRNLSVGLAVLSNKGALLIGLTKNARVEPCSLQIVFAEGPLSSLHTALAATETGEDESARLPRILLRYLKTDPEVESRLRSDPIVCEVHPRDMLMEGLSHDGLQDLITTIGDV